MATSTFPTTGARRPHSVPTHASLRRHRRTVLAWSLAHGHPVERDALAVIVGLRSRPADGALDRRWTTDDVETVLRSDASIWCAVHGTTRPSGLGTTLATYLRYLAAHRMLEPGSDRPSDLRRAVTDRAARRGPGRSSHPAGRARRPAPVVPIG